MASDEKGNLWFLQGVKQEGDPNQQVPSPGPQPPYPPQNPTNPFNKLTQSPPPPGGSPYPNSQSGYPQSYPPPHGSPYPPHQQSPPYPQQQNSPWPQPPSGPFSPPQGPPYPPQQVTPYPQQSYPPQQQPPYPPQQDVYAQSGTYGPPQPGYPQQQGSPYPQPGLPQQGYGPPQTQFSGSSSQPSGEASSFYGPGQPGQGPGGPGDRGFFDSAMQIAGVQQPQPGPDGFERGWFSSSKNPLDPPPKMFKRPAPGHYAYAMFRPISVLAVSERLQDGFALMPPVTRPGDPHPFISHDITEEDWHKFLKDFQKTAHLSTSDRLFQGMANSFMNGKLPSAKIQQRIAENKLEPIGDYLMAWNHYFFHPRRMSIILAKGTHRFSGETDDYPPDVGGHSKKGKKDKKDKKSHKTRSPDFPLVTAAEPYPKGSLIGDVLNPLHKAIHETSMAVAMAPHEALYGVTQKSGHKTKIKKYSDSDWDSDYSFSSFSSFSSGSDYYKYKVKKKSAGKEYRKEERKARKEARKAKKYGKVKESSMEFPSGRFRLVLCYWDGLREVA